MANPITRSEQIERLLDRVAGVHTGGGDPRTKQIVRRVVSDLFKTIEELDVTPDEYWAAVSYLTALGQSRETALLSPGLGFDHFIDILTDAKDRDAGLPAGTPRTIEGPLYVSGAPRVKEAFHSSPHASWTRSPPGNRAMAAGNSSSAAAHSSRSPGGALGGGAGSMLSAFAPVCRATLSNRSVMPTENEVPAKSIRPASAAAASTRSMP